MLLSPLLGKFNAGSNSNIYQELAGALPGGEFATAAYFNGAVYYGPVGSALTWRLPGP
jgi:hypothetical protein